MMFCPLWSLVQQKLTHCLKHQCGMYNFCRPGEFRIDRCPHGHDKVDEVTAGDSKVREFICLEDGCDAKWNLPFGDGVDAE